MANNNVIQTLIDLSTRQSETVAVRLNNANKTKLEAQQKLTMLQEYRNEYAEQLNLQLARGLSSSHYSNYQQFLIKLDTTINQQKQILQSSHATAEKHRLDWQASERKRLSYSVLTKKSAIALQQLETRREQKQCDEFAARIKLKVL